SGENDFNETIELSKFVGEKKLLMDFMQEIAKVIPVNLLLTGHKKVLNFGGIEGVIHFYTYFTFYNKLMFFLFSTKGFMRYVINFAELKDETWIWHIRALGRKNVTVRASRHENTTNFGVFFQEKKLEHYILVCVFGGFFSPCCFVMFLRMVKCCRLETFLKKLIFIWLLFELAVAFLKA
ncbi:hypothetical protein RFI_29674, partial [Reticulomyxa filosa]